jgi:DNA invertase Pin-like site-specific DNA recombinase
LICTEQSFKLDSPEGRMLATVLGAFAAFESDLISARSRDALAIVKAQGSRSGRPIGNPGFTSAQPETVSRILDLRSKGLGLSEIARRLDREGIPTAQGGRHWRAGVIQKILKREEALSAS